VRLFTLTMSTTPTSRYSPDWPKIANAVKNLADWHCHRCGIQCLRPGDRLFTPKQRANLLQVHHCDCNPANNSPENLVALCTVCHLHMHRKHHGTILAGQGILALGVEQRLPARSARRVPLIVQLDLWSRGVRWRQLGFWD
jgi:hypothetical protein